MGQRSTDTSRACFAQSRNGTSGASVRLGRRPLDANRGRRAALGGLPGDRRGRGRPLRRGRRLLACNSRPSRRGRPATTVGGQAGRGSRDGSGMGGDDDATARRTEGGKRETRCQVLSCTWPLAPSRPPLASAPSYRTCEGILAAHGQRVTRLRGGGIFSKKNHKMARGPGGRRLRGRLRQGGAETGLEAPECGGPQSLAATGTWAFGSRSPTEWVIASRSLE